MFRRFRVFVACLVLFLVCTPLVGAVSLEVHSKAVNLGRGWFDDDQDYWNQSNDEFNVFTVTEQADDGYDYVALFCPQAYINEGTGLVRITKADNSSYDIQDACVAADGRLWVATDAGIYRSTSNWGTTVRWINDTDYFLKIMSGDAVRLRFDTDHVYAGVDEKIYEISYTILAPIEVVSQKETHLIDFYVKQDGDIASFWIEDAPTSTNLRVCLNDGDTYRVDEFPDGRESLVRGSLHVNESDFWYLSWDMDPTYGEGATYNYYSESVLIGGTDPAANGTWSLTGEDLHRGSTVYGFYNNEGLHSYRDEDNNKFVGTFATQFNQPYYAANPFTEDANITGIIYSPHSQYYKNQDFTIAYRIAYHFTEWFVSAVGGYESGVEADAYSDLMNRYRFSVELSYNGTQIGTYTCPTDQGSWSGENYNETCGFGGVFDCENTIDLIQRKYLTFTPGGELWEDSGTYTAQLLITNKTTLEQFTLASDTFTVLNQTYNESTGYLPPEEEIPEDAGEPEAIFNNIFYFMTLPIFWGLVLYIGFIVGMAQTGVNGTAIGFIAFLLLQLFAVVGLFAPYTIYILVVSWIGAGMFFTIGRKLIYGGGGEY